ncbi:MAG TPA: SLBB domain-containing protein [Gemmatimonadaceae bacterium]
MKLSRLYGLAFIALIGATRALAAQQQLPTPDQAKSLLATRPDLVAALYKEIASSGMTPDQIHARLRAAGYPEDLLDGYISQGGSGSQLPGRDSLSAAMPTEDMLDAMSDLGLADTISTSALRTAIRARSSAALGRGNGRGSRDSLGRSIDLTLLDSIVDPADTLPLPDVVDSLGRLVTPIRAKPGTRIPRIAAPDTGMTIFGLNVFSNETTQFDPNVAGPVDAAYRIAAGDRLVLILTGDTERSFTLDVTRDGSVLVQGVGEIQAANLTLGQLEDELYAKLGRVYSGLRRGADATTHFSLTVARMHANQVYVLGDVDQPGSYRISGAGTALTALYAAGGPTANGSMRRVEIRRGGKLVDTLDLYDYLLHADGSHDPHLQSGDVVFVPVHGARVRLYGEVTRPGTYEMQKSETLADLLRAAGGFTASAERQRVQVARILPPDQRRPNERPRVVIDVASDDSNPEAAPPFPVEPGDVVRVFKVTDQIGRRITVRGDVGTPGIVGFTPGMHLSDALRAAGGLKPDAYLGQVLVSRLRDADSTREQLRASLRDSTGRAVNDILLRQDDEIRVFSVTELRATEYIAITGAVHRPGRYPYREGMTLRDLVLLAGGLDERASLREAEIARLPRTGNASTLAVSQRVPLDSTYLVVAQARPASAGGVMQAGATSEVSLEPFDNVLILSQPDRVQPRRVVIAGEVRSPGTYTLLDKDERLHDLIERAGGLSNPAANGGIIFYRRENHIGRVGVDLANAMRNPTSHDDLLLADGDSIFLPPFSAIVDVRGAVNAPRGVAWVPGANLDYYVRAAGGGSHNAEVNRSYVTQPDGSVESVRARRFLPDDIPVPKPGSVVYVTENTTPDKSDPIARWSIIAQIVGSLVTIAAITRHP